MNVQFAVQKDIAVNLTTPTDTLLCWWSFHVLYFTTPLVSQNFGYSTTENTEITIRIVTSNEIKQLNKTYRAKNNSTNVLSFPLERPLAPTLPWIGDLVLCAEVIHQEALRQRKSWLAHWAHMIVHGSLHLIGFDHITLELANIMEPLEIRLLASLGFANPFAAARYHQ